MRSQKDRGFTLVELMIAIAIMAVMGAMSWMALDVMLRTKTTTQQHAVATSELQIALQQWTLDLDRARLLAETEPMGWDGKVFRLTRTMDSSSDGVVVVAWAVRMDADGQMRLMRWQSRPVTTLSDWKQSWQNAVLWSRGGDLQGSVSLISAQSMDVHIWSVNAWTSGLSSRESLEQADTTTSNQSSVGLGSSTTSNTTKVLTQPSGVRVTLQSTQGVLVKDWVSPLFSTAKS